MLARGNQIVLQVQMNGSFVTGAVWSNTELVQLHSWAWLGLVINL